MFRIGSRRRSTHQHRDKLERRETTALVYPIEGELSTPPGGGPGRAGGFERGGWGKRRGRETGAEVRIARTSPGSLQMSGIREEGEGGREHTVSDRDDDGDDGSSKGFLMDLGLVDDVTCDEGFNLGEVRLPFVTLRCVYSLGRRLEETCRHRRR